MTFTDEQLREWAGTILPEQMDSDRWLIRDLARALIHANDRIVELEGPLNDQVEKERATLEAEIIRLTQNFNALLEVHINHEHILRKDGYKTVRYGPDEKLTPLYPWIRIASKP